MKVFLLLGCFVLSACTPQANNNNAAVKLPGSDDGSGKDPVVTDPEPNDQPTTTPNPDDPGKPTPEPPVPDDPALKSCKNDGKLDESNAYLLDVQWDATEAAYRTAFKNAADQNLNVVSLYVTGQKDAVPVFPDFKFSGDAYWLLSVDDPFEQSFALPVMYGKAPALAIDNTKAYGGVLGGGKIKDLKVATCIKFTAITFDFDNGFQYSKFFVVHRP